MSGQTRTADREAPRVGRRAGGWAIAAVGSIGGWLLVSGGLGLGVPRWVGGTVVAGAFAGVALACGVGLLVAAAIGLIRATRGWGRLVLVPWVLIVLVLTYSLSIAFAAAFPSHPRLEADTPPGAQTVTMVADDGTALEGWYFPSGNGAAVVVRHGAGSTRAEVLDQARVLVDAGYGVLVVDARGHGGSAGRGMDLGWYGELDTRAALDLLITRPDVDPGRIAVLGLSMGGEEAIGAAADDGRIRAVVAEGATGRTAADKEWLADQYGAAGMVQGWLDRITYASVVVLTGLGPPRSLEDAVRAADATPFLLIAGGGVPDETFVAERLQTVAADRVDVWVVPASGHVGGLSTAPDAWRARVVGFLDDVLAVTAGE
jgi:pimeloyl-ACP methyl ester carboxylesterase